MDIKSIKTKPYPDQKPGTSGLRKKVSVYKQDHYLENYIQSIFDSLKGFEGKTLVVGGDGRYFNHEAIQVVIKMAIANQFGTIMVGQNGILSTPAVSYLIRKYEAFGGLILTASHNPGGPDGDFGIKFNTANGGAALEGLTDAFFKRSQVIDHYWMVDIPDVDLSEIGEKEVGGVKIQIIDSVQDYAEYMQEIFDFKAIQHLFKNGFKMRFDAMNGVTGPYAHRIFEQMLGADLGTVVHGTPLPDFGGLHPEPNLVHAKHLVDMMYSSDALDFAAASDGDGDRYLILGKNFFLNPSDSLAIMAQYIDQIPFYQDKIYGVARSMPTSYAVDFVAKDKNYPLYETPTGWKFFGTLLEADKATICGEESFGASSLHIREKDGIWAILFWLNILALTGKSVSELTHALWEKYGRVYTSLHNYEELDADTANTLLNDLKMRLPDLKNQQFKNYQIQSAEVFNYTDVVTGEVSANQGIQIYFTDGSRVVTRLSGTGSSGATLRLYFNRLITDPAKLDLDVQLVLKDLIEVASEILKIKEYTGRDYPTVIT